MDKNKKTDNTEHKILEAAKQIFLKKGMYGARMQEIADEAGINKALLHYYFRSKDKLFEAIFKEAFQEFVPKAFGILKGDQPFEEKLKGFVANYIDTIVLNPYLPIFIINEINQNPKRLGHIHEMMQMVRVEITKSIDEGVQAGIYREVDPMQLFSNMMAMTLFPFLARPIIQEVFEYDSHKFKEFIEERKKIIPEVILTYLKNSK